MRRVKVTEGLGETRSGEHGQGIGVGGCGSADHGVLSVGRLNRRRVRGHVAECPRNLPDGECEPLLRT